jgi:hypothetical protein
MASTYIDPVSYEEYNSEEADFIQLGAFKYHPSTIKMLIENADLGIHIDNATEDEFVLTACSDRIYNDPNLIVNPLRLRNPMTNLAFTIPELQYIYRKLTTAIF